MKLFDPMTILDMDLDNRIVSTPVVTRMATEDGSLTPEQKEFHLRRAKGGVGMMVFEDAMVHPMPKTRIVGIYDDKFIPGLKSFVDDIHGKTTTKIGIQITHLFKHYAHKGFQDQKVEDLTLQDIDKIIDLFGKAAIRIKKAGFDFLELDCCNISTLASFLSIRNNRVDEYGKTMEERFRIVAQTFERVRKEVGKKFPLGARINGDEFIVGGNTLKQSRVIARMLAELGISYLSVTCGEKFEDLVLREDGSLQHGYSYVRCFPPSYMPDAVNVYMAADLKKVVERYGIPVITAGKIPTPDLAEAILDEGKSDLIGLCRPLICDPDWPKKSKEGRWSKIRKCTYCNVCMECNRRIEPIICALWEKKTVG